MNLKSTKHGWMSWKDSCALEHWNTPEQHRKPPASEERGFHRPDAALSLRRCLKGSQLGVSFTRHLFVFWLITVNVQWLQDRAIMQKMLRRTSEEFTPPSRATSALRSSDMTASQLQRAYRETPPPSLPLLTGAPLPDMQIYTTSAFSHHKCRHSHSHWFMDIRNWTREKTAMALKLWVSTP